MPKQVHNIFPKPKTGNKNLNNDTNNNGVRVKKLCHTKSLSSITL
jgi:hypothetical protein